MIVVRGPSPAVTPHAMRYRGDKMKVIEYFTSENQTHWLEQIGKCDWGAGMLLDYGESIATVMGREYIYISICI